MKMNHNPVPPGPRRTSPAGDANVRPNRKEEVMRISRWPRVLLLMLITGFLVLVALPASGDTVVIDFEEFYGMFSWSGEPIPEAARLSDQLADTYGVVFSSGAPYVAVVALPEGAAPSGINAIGGSTPDGILTYDREWPVVFTFVDPEHPTLPATTDFVSVRGDLWGDSGMGVILNAYDIDGHLVDSDQQYDSGGETLTVTGPGIHRVEFLGSYDTRGVALDDLTFNPVEHPVPVKSQTWGRIKGLYR
jgi:hypothetical protein